MPLSNPWLAGPSPGRDLPREQLEERILNLLSTHNLAVIATVNHDGSPTATTRSLFRLGASASHQVRVRHLGLPMDQRLRAL